VSAENFLGGGGGQPEKKPKRPKISKKYRKIALFASSRRGNGKIRPKNSKKYQKNSTICLFQEGQRENKTEK